MYYWNKDYKDYPIKVNVTVQKNVMVKEMVKVMEIVRK